MLYAANVFFAGRLFLNRCLATKRFASRFSEPIFLAEDFYADIRWWQSAIKSRNGVSFLVPESSLDISLDASTDGWYEGLPGLGAYNHENHEYFTCTVPSSLRHLEIADLELVAHVVSLHVWADQWCEKQVTIHTDNQACWHLLNNGRSRQDIRLRMSRWMASCQIEKQFRVSSAWIPTSENNLADALSRYGDKAQRDKFAEHCHSLGGIPSRRHIVDCNFIFE